MALTAASSATLPVLAVAVALLAAQLGAGFRARFAQAPHTATHAASSEGIPTFFVHRHIQYLSGFEDVNVTEYLKFDGHPARVNDEDKATFSFVCCLSHENSAAFQALPVRSSKRPYLVWTHKLSFEGENCNTTDCDPARKLIAARTDFLYINYDLHDHELGTDSAASLSPGVTVAPPKFDGGPSMDVNTFGPPKFFLTFRGKLNLGFSQAPIPRADIAAAFKTLHRSDVAIELESDDHELTGYDVERGSQLMDTAFALVPPGHERWSFRFSEAVGACAIPVVMTDGITWPYSQLVDWSGAALQLKARHVEPNGTATQRWTQAFDAMLDLLEHPDSLLSQLPQDPLVIERMRRKVCDINNKYFANAEKRWTAVLLSASAQVGFKVTHTVGTIRSEVLDDAS